MNDSMIEALFEQLQQLSGEIKILQASLAFAKNPGLAAQYPEVAEQIAQREQMSISSLNAKIEAEKIFK